MKRRSDYATVSEAAQVLGVHRNTVGVWIEKKKLSVTYRRRGRQNIRLVPWAEVHALLRGNQDDPAGKPTSVDDLHIDSAQLAHEMGEVLEERFSRRFAELHQEVGFERGLRIAAEKEVERLREAVRRLRGDGPPHH